MDEKNIIYLYLIGITLFLIGIVLYSIYQNDDGFKITELSEGVSYEICTASIEAPFLYEKSGNMGFQIYPNTTQEQLDKWIEGHSNTIITLGSVCIGNRLEIRG